MYRSSKTIMDNAPHGMSEFACLVAPILLHTQYNAKPSASAIVATTPLPIGGDMFSR